MDDSDYGDRRHGLLRRIVYRWFPWKHVVRWLAQGHDLFDPFALVTRLDRLAQPSEVRAPWELVRHGIQFHARGTMNARVIQNNLDWQWPYWVRRQFDPGDESFLPRGFSVSHVNLTHRNWTAVGLPGCRAFPIVDPRGLLTPFYDGWSLEAAVVPQEGRALLPARLDQVAQRLEMDERGLAVVTEGELDGLRLRTQACMQSADGRPVCRLAADADADRPASLVLSLRPCNPEGVSFVNEIQLHTDENPSWTVDGDRCVWFGRAPDRHATSAYADGDVFLNLLDRPPTSKVEDEAGLASAAAFFRIEPGRQAQVTVRVTLEDDKQSRPLLPRGQVGSWEDALDGTASLEVPDERFQMIYDAAVRSIVLHSPSEVYPGPYTYKRFWFRDAVLILNAMLCAGLDERARHVIDRFEKRQRVDGFFLSQNGEWDANGQVLWAYDLFSRLTGRPPARDWRRPVLRGARWIGRKRVSPDKDVRHAGLLPAGFSAEHLGNNDFYYWDDFWGVAGLRGAARLCRQWGEDEHAAEFRAEADDLMRCIERSLGQANHRRQPHGLPASPYRRMDAGAVGSLAVSYPLGLWDPQDRRVLATVEFLRRQYFLDGAFFHALSHSGINAYLTLHIAQAMLRAGDRDFFGAVERIGELASPTGQWPEAIHPQTLGGCMGDGQHIWAAAEWVMMLRNMFVREEGDRLILASGIPQQWLDTGRAMSFGPAPTSFGPVTVRVEPTAAGPQVEWDGRWRQGPPPMEVRLPGGPPRTVEPERQRQPGGTPPARR